MNRINIYIVVLFCFVMQIGLSQPKNNILKDVAMPAPNAAALGKYGDIPVSYFTGVPNVSVPIYTVQEGGLSVPISLSYHASGVKVAETASWVGLNWSLNAGGMITRSVMGIPDELQRIGYLDCASRLLPPLSSGNLTATLQADSIGKGNLDSEPDMYTFNVGGYSGKFTFDGNKKVHFIPRADFKVEYRTRSFSNGLQEISRFILTAPDGTRYIFGTDSLSNYQGLEYQSFDNSNPWTNAPSSWYLVAVESHDGKNRIRLRYEEEIYSYKSLASWTNEGATSWQSGGIPFSPYKNLNTSYLQGRRLAAIYSSTSVVKFVPNSTARTDLDGSVGARSLSKIEIRNGLDSNTCYNAFEFFTSYFTSSGGSSTAHRRLRLDSLKERACDGSIVNPAYTFTYHAGNIPDRHSYAIDHWGFANGQTGNDNTYNVPANGVLPSTPPAILATANRESSYSDMVAGTIQRIKYPTGGHTEFGFEANRVSNTSYNITYQTVQATKYETTTCNIPPSSTACCNSDVSVLKTFTMQELGLNFPEEMQTSVYMRLDLINLLNVPNPNNPGGFKYCTPSNPQPEFNPVEVTLEIWRTSDNNLVFSHQFNINVNKTSDTWPQSPIEKLATMLQVDVQYRIVMRTINGRASFKLYRKELVGSGGGSTTGVDVGGLRIKEIKHHDGRSAANDVVKRYHYTQAFGSNQSSGILYYRPVYMGTVTSEGGYTPSGLLKDPFTIFFSSSITPLGAFHGHHIGYSNVWEENVNGGGRTQYQFSQVYNLYDGNINPAYPIPPAEAQLSFGLEQFSTQYNDAGTEQAKTETQYKTFQYQYLPGRIFKIYRSPVTTPSGSTDYQFTKVVYQIRTAAVLVARKIETVDGVSTTTEFQYDLNDRHLAPTAVSTTNSDNKTTTTYNYYVYDLPNTQATLQQELLKRYIIAQPMWSQVYVNNLQTGGSRQDFALFNQNNGLPNLSPSSATGHHPYLYQVYNYEMTWDNANSPQAGNWELQATINKYDMVTGKPAEMTHNNWPFPEKYTWNATTKLIQSRQYNNFFWYYDYINGTRLVSRIRDIDDQFVDYFYDPLQRLSEAKARNNSVRALYTYRYKGQLGATSNYVKTENIVTQVDATNSSIGTRNTFQYLDGLGRPLQTVAQAASPTGKDVISSVAYDVQGRVLKEFTPYESTGSTGAFFDVPTNVPSHPHVLKSYEGSPLSRVLIVTPPGWYASTTSYGSNTTSDAVLVGTDAFSVYAAGSLRKTTVTDPDGKQAITFTDKLGRTVLSRIRSANGSETAETYSVYDDKNRVTKVVPPGASHFFTPDLVFTYRYDGGDRIIEKKVPDAALGLILYNNRDLPALSFLPKEGKWLGTLYDTYGRPTQVGFVAGSATAAPNPNGFSFENNGLLSESFYDGSSGGGITRTATAIDKGKVTTTRSRVLGTASDFLTSTNFYDTYGRPSSIRQNNHLSLTMSATASPEFITRTYDMADNLLTETRVHSIDNGATNRTITTRNRYDSQGRVYENYFNAGDGERQTAALGYNFRNEIIERNLGKTPSSFLQSLDYTYNAQGWLLAINQNALTSSVNPLYFPPQAPSAVVGSLLDQNDLFHLELRYDNPQTNLEIPAQIKRNGNISQLSYRVRGRATEVWGFEYDYLDRLTNAQHMTQHESGSRLIGQYSEKITYADARGNIAAIQRFGAVPTAGGAYGGAMIDNLSFTPKPGSNQFLRIADNAPAEFAPKGFKPTAGAQNNDYTYDNVGNQTNDPHKGISSITYNYLNLPSVITWANGNKIEIQYDAAGMKLSKKVSVGTTEQYTQHYMGSVEYNAVGTTRKLEAIYFADGRVYNTNVTTTSANVALRYEYAIRDHLENTRLMFTDLDGSSTIGLNEVIQENHYYPFGMNMEGVWMNDGSTRDSKYLYNGKEMNEDFGWNVYDYGFRFYDPAMIKFVSIDPIANEYPELTTYQYASNRPVDGIDLDGLEFLDFQGRSLGPIADPQKYANEHGIGVREEKPGSNLQIDMWQPEITISSEKKEMISPIENPKITSEVSPKRLHPTKKIMRSHDGADIVPKDGKKKNVPVLVPVDGKIETVKLEKDYPNDAGNRVHMKDKNGYRHSFFHLEEGIKVKSGQTVKRGDTIGIMGESGGISTGVHLHYEIRDPKGKLLNPRKANPSLTDAPGPGKAKPKP